MERDLAAAVRTLAELHDEQREEAMLAEGAQAERRAEREALEAAVAQAEASGKLVVFPGRRAWHSLARSGAARDTA